MRRTVRGTVPIFTPGNYIRSAHGSRNRTTNRAAYQRMLQATTAPSTLLASTASAGQPPSGLPSAPAMEEPPSTASPEDAAYDFAVTQEFLAVLESGHTIQPQFSAKLGQHSGIHKLQDDCELHIAGDVQNSTLGWPKPVVIEPPNVCKNAPSEAGSSAGDWLGVFDSVAGTICQVSGFPRIFTEHASGSAGASNPNHVFEIHPATQINCGAQQQLNFATLLKVHEGMRAIAPSTTSACIHDRKLFVRYDNDRQQYVFREQGGRCGNFAIVEVQNVLGGTIRKVGGGHSAIARVSADGQSLTTLKLYTLSPSAIDTWMDQGATSDSRVLLHGLFTYDYFAMQRVLHPVGQDWQKPTEWTPLRYPLALVVFGETQTVPWEEQ